MSNQITRRHLMRIGALGATCSIIGCDGEVGKTVGDTAAKVGEIVKGTVAHAGDAIGDAVIKIGEVVLKIPHVAGKVVGVMLISAGAVLKVYVATLKGEPIEVDIKLTPEQILQIQKAIASGQQAKIKQLDGTDKALTVPQQ